MSHQLHDEFSLAVRAALADGVASAIPVGGTVICDCCNTDMTADPRTGGFTFLGLGGTWTAGPCCAAMEEARLRRQGRERSTAVSRVTLSPRQEAALLALADLGVLAEGHALAESMRVYRPSTSIAAAHQAANGLDSKGLAVKRRVINHPIRYELTAAGRDLVARIRSAS